jgi:hypothetical protein
VLLVPAAAASSKRKGGKGKGAPDGKKRKAVDDDDDDDDDDNNNNNDDDSDTDERARSRAPRTYKGPNLTKALKLALAARNVDENQWRSWSARAKEDWQDTHAPDTITAGTTGTMQWVMKMRDSIRCVYFACSTVTVTLVR